MKTEILMPSLSPTMEEGSLAKWYVAPGDKVKPGDIIADIETDKALMEYESIEEGTIVELIVKEGTENIKVNSLIAVIETEGAEEINTKEVDEIKIQGQSSHYCLFTFLTRSIEVHCFDALSIICSKSCKYKNTNNRYSEL